MSKAVIDGLQNSGVDPGAADEPAESSIGKIYPQIINAVAQNLKIKRGTAELLVIGAIGIVIFKVF